MSNTGPLKIHGITDRVANFLASFVSGNLSQSFDMDVQVSIPNEANLFEVTNDSNKKSWWGGSSEGNKAKKIFLVCTEMTKVLTQTRNNELESTYDGEGQVIFTKAPEDYRLSYSFLVEGSMFSKNTQDALTSLYSVFFDNTIIPIEGQKLKIEIINNEKKDKSISRLKSEKLCENLTPIFFLDVLVPLSTGTIVKRESIVRKRNLTFASKEAKPGEFK